MMILEDDIGGNGDPVLGWYFDEFVHLVAGAYSQLFSVDDQDWIVENFHVVSSFKVQMIPIFVRYIFRVKQVVYYIKHGYFSTAIFRFDNSSANDSTFRVLLIFVLSRVDSTICLLN